MSNVPKRQKGKKGQKRPPRKGNRMFTQSVRNVSIISPTPVSVTNSVFPFSSGVLPLSASGLGKAQLSWLSSYMGLFDEFRFVDLQFEWIPAASAFTTSQIGFYYDPDPNAEAPTSFGALSGNAGLVLSQVSQKATLRVPRSRLNRLPWYTVHGTRSTDTQGNFCYAITAGNVPNGTGNVALGNFVLRYTVVCRNPTGLDTPAMQRGSEAEDIPPVTTEQQLSGQLDVANGYLEKMAKTVHEELRPISVSVWSPWKSGAREGLPTIDEEGEEALSLEKQNELNGQDPRFVRGV